MFKSSFVFFLLFTLIIPSLRAEKVAVILPMEHMSLRQIKDGFISTMQKHLPKTKVDVFNAHGDINQIQAILKTISSRNYNYVAPIGTVASQMAIKLFTQTPIISIASELNDNFVKHRNLYIVEDKSNVEENVDFILKVLPNLQKATLIYSNEARIGKESRQMKSSFIKHKLILQMLNANNIAELIQSLKNIDKDSDVIILLKDHMVVSAIAAIYKQARQLNIPIIAADEGSIINGADIGLAVKEKELGVLGAQIIIDLKKRQLKKTYQAEFFVMQNSQSKIKCSNCQSFTAITIKNYK